MWDIIKAVITDANFIGAIISSLAFIFLGYLLRSKNIISADGTGGEFFYKLLADCKNAEEAYQKLNDVEPKDTEFDQWEAQILARILTKAHVIIVSDKCDPAIITAMHIKHAYTLDEALAKASELVGTNKKITIIPDGISVIVK